VSRHHYHRRLLVDTVLLLVVCVFVGFAVGALLGVDSVLFALGVAALVGILVVAVS